MIRLQYKIGICVSFIWVLFAIWGWPRFRHENIIKDESVPLNQFLERLDGSEKFNASKFRYGTEIVRLSMMKDLINDENYIKKTNDQIIDELGQGEEPGIEGQVYYLIRGARKEWNDNAEYFLTFDYGKNGVVHSPIVVRRCCKSPYATYLYVRLGMKLKQNFK